MGLAQQSLASVFLVLLRCFPAATLPQWCRDPGGPGAVDSMEMENNNLVLPRQVADLLVAQPV